MRTTNDIAAEIEEMIPAELRAKYAGRTYAEMAEVDELAEWADVLRRAEQEWNALEGQ